MNRTRKLTIDRKRGLLFVWMGVAYLSLWLFSDCFNHRETFASRVVNNTWLVVYLVVINFIFFEYTLPAIRLSWRGILIGLSLLFSHFLLYSFGLYIWRGVGILLGIYTPLRTPTALLEDVCYHFPYSLMSVAFFGIIRHFYNYIKLKQAAQQTRIEKQEGELNYLKAQTNPHFLFNTLNNIYSLSQDKSDLAPESILRLSKILRFMLYETGGEYIDIEQEIKIISDYIALEKLRYDDTLRVDFQYQIEDAKQPIPPLLLIPLVENAFKHGAAETRDQPYIKIQLSANQRQLAFRVKNSIENSSQERTVKENIGLSNLRRQLALLYTDYQLSVQQGDAAFTATLNINLASHV